MPNLTAFPSKSQCVVLLLLCFLACGPGDPLEEIRLQQERGGDVAATVEPLRELIDEGAEDPEVYYRYGVALLAAGDHALAPWPLREAMKSPEWLARAGLTLAVAYLGNGDFDGAIDATTAVLVAEPDHLEALALRADARVRSRRQYEEALVDTEQILEIDPDHIGALTSRTVALLGLGRAEEAGELLEALEGRYSDDTLGLRGSPTLCAASATFAKEKGELEKAEERFEVCVETFPTDPVVLKEAIGFFDALGRGARSLEILQDVVAATPEAYGYRLSLVERLDAMGRSDDAEEVLAAGTEVASPREAAVVWSAIALRRMEQDRFDDAATAWSKARELDASGNPELAFGYADALVVAGRVDEALALADTFPIAPYRELVRGRAHLAKGDPEKALVHLTEGIRLWPNNAAARYYAAVAAEQTGDFERAVEEYRYALRIDATATDAYLRLARLHAAAGQDEPARTALEFMPGNRPDESKAALLHLEILARRGEIDRVPRARIEQMVSRVGPGPAVAAMARGLADRAAPADVVRFVEEREGLALGDPANADALDVLVDALAATGKKQEAIARAASAVAAAPQSARFQAIHAKALHRAGGEIGEARAAYERALAIDPTQPDALAGLAALEADAGNVETALGLHARHAEVEDPASEPVRAFAALLAAQGRGEEAERQLEALLRDHPYDAEAALDLAKLRRARGVVDARTRELARRAVRFRGGEQARAFLDGLPAAS